MSEDGGGVVMGGVEEEILDVDIEFQLGEYIDQLSDKKLAHFMHTRTHTHTHTHTRTHVHTHTHTHAHLS